MARTKKENGSSSSTATFGFEAKLWLAADKLRNNMDPAVSKRSGDRQPEAVRRASEARPCKHAVPGLDTFRRCSALSPREADPVETVWIGNTTTHRPA